jgi:tetratricopeptide (TPR) repeat protein
MVTGLVVDGTGFEVLAGGERIGPRRTLEAPDVGLLTGLAGRYVRVVQARADGGVLLGLGRELFAWLDGDQGQLTGLLERAARPVMFEVAGPRSPSEAGWALLRAPFELLARPDGGFLAEDQLARFCVARRLGAAQEPPGLDGFRLGLAFMASAPRGQHELDFEAEEAAILQAVGEARVDLVVDDTGDPAQLAHRLASLGGLPVVHLSCHGLNNYPAGPGGAGVPVLLMEDELGGPRLTTAADLAGLLTRPPRLLFVSACLTAAAADATAHLPPGDGHKGGPASGSGGGGGLVAHSLATALVSAGIPAVLGWEGSVDDRAATLFAGRLYQALANRGDVVVAAGDAARVLLASDDPVVRADWHLARVWLGPAGGGPVVTGNRKRTLVSAMHGTKTFLDRKQQVPVATAEMFVGRRLELQQALRALRSGEKAGVLLHGQGRLGKSSLAARIADRCPDYAVAVVFGDYSPLAVLDAISTAVRTNTAARQVIEAGLPKVRQQPAAVEEVMVDLLAGPCAQAGENGQRPLLLVLDDLEQILVADPAGPHKVDPGHAGALAAVLGAFGPEQTDSRVLVTSRFTFTLSGLEARLEDVQLRPLSPVAQRKLQGRQQDITPAERVTGRASLAGRVLAVSRGNPGLQDLIGLRLVYAEHIPQDRAEQAVAGMEAYLRQGDLPADTEVRAFLENLALDTLLQEAGPSGVALLRAATLFDLPVPGSVIDALAAQVGGSPDRLRGLGLLVPFPDPHDPARTALAADPLATGRTKPLTPGEQAVLAAISVRLLFTTWGGAAQRPGRDRALDLQLARLALLVDDPAVTAACAAGAVIALRTGPAADAFALGQEAVKLLDRHGHAVPLALLRQSADAALTSGDGPAGGALLGRAAEQAQARGGQSTSLVDQARVIGEQARHLIVRGELQQAEQLLTQAAQLFTTAGAEDEAATAMGEIAGILYQRGDYDEALRIRRDVELPVYERLGQTRSIAVTWGHIADIAYRRGDYDEALRIRRELQLPAFERLADTRETAIAWGRIADIASGRGDYDEALRIRKDVTLPVYERLGDTRSTAINWSKIADIAYQRGDYDEALRIRRELQLPAFERLGDTRSAVVTWGQIADIASRRGDYDEALRIRRNVELPVYERLGDTRSTAITWGKIAQIAYQRGDYDQAAEVQRKQLEAHRQLGDLEGIAATSWDLARMDLEREDNQAAFPRLIEAFQILGRLQRPEGIAVVGSALGQLLLAAGQADQARQVLTAARDAAAKLSRTDQVKQISELLGQAAQSAEGT